MILDFILIGECVILSIIAVTFWNLITAKKIELEPEPKSHAETNPWFTEHQFWARKAARAYIRFSLAKEAHDDAAMDVALKEHELYTRRMKAVVPTEVRERWAQSLEAEVAAAIAEKEDLSVDA